MKTGQDHPARQADRTDGAHGAAHRPPGLRWWREILYTLVFYGIYTAVRDTQGSAGGGATVALAPTCAPRAASDAHGAISAGAAARSATIAFHHALDVIRIERDLFIFHERAIQHAFIGDIRFYQFWDVWYGTAHFAATAAVAVWLFRRQPDRYPFWRNTLAFTTALALVGFALFPLMPPRLLPAGFGFVDTLRCYGGSWSFDSGAVQKISNQFAAMPSLHTAWSAWCASAVLPSCRHWWSRALAIAYPLATLFCILVTANHFFVDAAGGLVVVGLGAVIASPITRMTYRPRPASIQPE